MRNLLDIENTILSENRALRDGFRVEEINENMNLIFEGGLSKFNSSVKMAKIVKKSMDFFNSEECQNQLYEEGVSWTKEEFFMKLYGWKRAYGYKMLKLAEVHSSTIRSFVSKMQTLRDNGEDTKETSISVENCLKFIRGGGEETNTEPTTPNPTTLQLTCLIDGVKKKVTIKSNGDIKSNLTPSELNNQIELLNQVIVNNNNN
jgi:hypothetical protein